MYSGQLYLLSFHLKVFLSMPSSFVTLLPALWNSGSIITSTVGVRRDICDLRIWEGWLRQHPPWCTRVGMAPVSSGAQQWAQSLVLPDIACSHLGLQHPFTFRHIPYYSNSYIFWQEIPTQLDGTHRMFLFFASLSCSFPQAMCVFFYILAQKWFNRKKPSQRRASGKGFAMGNKSMWPLIYGTFALFFLLHSLQYTGIYGIFCKKSSLWSWRGSFVTAGLWFVACKIAE